VLCNLAYDMSPTEVVGIGDGCLLTKRDCLIEALDCDPEDACAYVLLGRTMGSTEVLNLKDGREMTRLQCFTLGDLEGS